MYQHDFLYLSETYLDASVPDSLLEIDRYNLVRADHPNDTKRGGVCICYKESLPVRTINLSYFTDKPGLSVDSGVHSSLHPSCYH